MQATRYSYFQQNIQVLLVLPRIFRAFTAICNPKVLIS